MLTHLFIFLVPRSLGCRDNFPLARYKLGAPQEFLNPRSTRNS
jgi:hypothetical protein